MDERTDVTGVAILLPYVGGGGGSRDHGKASMVFREVGKSSVPIELLYVEYYRIEFQQSLCRYFRGRS